MTYSRDELFGLFQRQLSLEYNCAPEDFDRPETENAVTVSRVHAGRRPYAEDAFFLQMATFGGNAVLTADERLHGWLREYARDKTGYRLFEHPHLREIEKELLKYGKRLQPTHHMFLPAEKSGAAGPCFPVKWFEEAEIEPFYADGRFLNALSEGYNPRRPDVLAVAAYDGGRIAALAGCSADTPLLWQIGIDVLPAYRGRGLGAGLVSLLRGEILRRGKIPFYGTGLSNLGSWRVALRCGFVPAWVETATAEK